MRSLGTHLPVLLLLAALVFASFGRLLGTPLWSPIDLQILLEAAPTFSDFGPMFQHVGTWFSQPLLRMFFALEHHLFCTSAAGYQAVNLGIHTLNAFLVYMLVNMLFFRRGMAILAAAMFAMSVGNYGKILMSVANQEALLLSHLYMLVLYLLIRNDFRHRGRLTSPYFVAGLALFLLAGLTRPTTFALLGSLLAYRFFFYAREGWRTVLSRNFLVLVAIGLFFYGAQARWGYRGPSILSLVEDPFQFGLSSIKTIFRYLNLMLFPLQPSALLAQAPGIVQLFFDLRTPIRFFLTLGIISFSIFGFVFGNRPLRFFIAWTYITVLPFTGVSTAHWLNLSHLYLTSVGFCIILAAGTTGAARLLRVRRWRQWLPYLVPAAYAVLALWLTSQMDAQNRRQGLRPEVQRLREAVAASCAGAAAEPGAQRTPPPAAEAGPAGSDAYL